MIDEYTEIGATGAFPKGSMDDADEGELAMRIGLADAGRVCVMDFGKSVMWLGMGKAEVERLVEILTNLSNLMKE